MYSTISYSVFEFVFPQIIHQNDSNMKLILNNYYQ